MMRNYKGSILTVIAFLFLMGFGTAQKKIPNDKYGTGLFIMKANTRASQRGSFIDQPDYIGNLYWDNLWRNQKGIGFWTGGNDGNLYSSKLRMAIRRNGNVGIGTIEPTRRLDVNGAFRVRGGGKNGDPMIDLDHTGSGNTRWSRINSEGMLALAANDQLGAGNSNPHVLIDQNGAVQITGGNRLKPLPSSAKHALYVQKGISSEDYVIGPKNTWADHVFAGDHEVMPLKKLKSFIEKERHLPNMPTQSEVAEEGYNLHKINVKLLEKVEELTLYILEQQEQMEMQQQQIKALQEAVHKQQ